MGLGKKRLNEDERIRAYSAALGELKSGPKAFFVPLQPFDVDDGGGC